MKISTILDQIDDGQIALPEFQRGYVWTREQVRELMTSLYKGYPIGSLMVWATAGADADVRHGDGSAKGIVKLLLDGQQRVTSLYGIVRGRPPKFFEGNEKAFSGLNFHLGTETFEFYGPVKMKNDPLWVDVTALLQPDGLKPWLQRLAAEDDFAEYLVRLNRLREILNIEIHHHTIDGPDKTVDIVVDVFNKVNSGGTMLSKGDLALAKLCATWPDARHVMNDHLAAWRKVGYDFKLDWLLRVTTAVLTGDSFFSALKDIQPTEFAAGLDDASNAVNKTISLVSARLGLDHDRVFGGRYAVPVMARWFSAHAEKLPAASEQDKLLYWYAQSTIWGRHSGSTETKLQQDLKALDSGGLDKLIDVLRDSRGDLTVRPGNFDGSTLGSRFYPLLYMLSRVWGAKDLGTGNELSAHMLGKLARLEVHHLFPKAVLSANGHPVGERNAVANFALLTQETNLAISARLPSEYFAEMEEKHPGVLASQWIPGDPDLWEVHRYHDFLAARRELLANAANTFFAELLGGSLEQAPDTPTPSEPVTLVAGSAFDEAEGPLRDLKEWFSRHKLPIPELYYEITDDDGGEVLAEVDAAWPEGLQPGRGQKIAFLLEHDDSTEKRLTTLGYRFFTSVDALKAYAMRLSGDLPENGDGASVGADDDADLTDEAPNEEEPLEGLDRILALADTSGVREAIDRAIEVADRHRLGKRTYKKSLMLTPPANRTKVLVNIAIVGADTTNNWVSDTNWADFYDVEMTEVVEALGAVGRHQLDTHDCIGLLDRVDDLLSSIDELDEPDQGPSVTQRIVSFLQSESGAAFTAGEVAERIGIRQHLATKRLSRLVSPRCPAKYSGAVRRRDDGTYEATTSAEPATAATPASAPADPADGERLLRDARLDVARRSKSEAGYKPTLFIQMISERGGLGTAKALLAAPGTSDGFAALWERGRLDLTVEAVVLRPEFQVLFSRQEIDVARRRLGDHGYSE